MNKSIEQMWKDGFIKEKIEIPKINQFYNKKSINLVEQIINEFERRIFFLIPLAIVVFLFNIWLENDHAVFWGIISASPSIVWFYLGKRQVESLVTIDYKANCYQYLIAIREKLDLISQFNKKLAISSIPIILFPMLLYTYFNQRGKTIGEIFGVEGLTYPTVTIFILLPLLTLIAYLIAEILFKKGRTKELLGIDLLIEEMQELKV